MPTYLSIYLCLAMSTSLGGEIRRVQMLIPILKNSLASFPLVHRLNPILYDSKLRALIHLNTTIYLSIYVERCIDFQNNSMPSSHHVIQINRIEFTIYC